MGPLQRSSSFVGRNGVNRLQQWKPVIPMLFALFYGASPLDLIPDVIPLIGLVDDSVIVPTFLVIALLQFRKSKQQAALAKATIR
jgi:uncharacterized membrane protein YkvA (DUF1232 family)